MCGPLALFELAVSELATGPVAAGGSFEGGAVWPLEVFTLAVSEPVALARPIFMTEGAADG